MGFLGKKPQTLLIPIYSTTVLYDKVVQRKHVICWLYYGVNYLSILIIQPVLHPLKHIAVAFTPCSTQQSYFAQIPQHNALCSEVLHTYISSS